MQINSGGHIIGAAVGSGLTAKLAALGGADILLALSAGKYRIMGRSSFSSYFCYGNNNSQVMELSKREVAAIKLANHFELFTMSFVTNEKETRQMLAAGVNVICVHLGLTRGGFQGYHQIKIF